MNVDLIWGFCKTGDLRSQVFRLEDLKVALFCHFYPIRRTKMSISLFEMHEYVAWSPDILGYPLNRGTYRKHDWETDKVHHSMSGLFLNYKNYTWRMPIQHAAHILCRRLIKMMKTMMDAFLHWHQVAIMLLFPVETMWLSGNAWNRLPRCF